MDQEELFKEYSDRQKFEHELINRRVTWLLTSQTILFAAYGIGASKGIVISQQFLCVVSACGLLSSFLLFLGIVAGALAKWRSWKDYLDLLQNLNNEVYGSKISVPKEHDKLRKNWGVRTEITILALVPDLFLPLIFLGAWVFVLQC